MLYLIMNGKDESQEGIAVALALAQLLSGSGGGSGSARIMFLGQEFYFSAFHWSNILRVIPAKESCPLNGAKQTVGVSIILKCSWTNAPSATPFPLASQGLVEYLTNLPAHAVQQSALSHCHRNKHVLVCSIHILTLR